jgi:predicted  nucleic acid-binding Zn-ribbon protein
MENVYDLLDGLEGKIRHLIQEKEKLADQVRTFEQTIDNQQNQINQLSDQLATRTEEGRDGEDFTKEGLKAEIDRLVREIEYCIELLNK